MASFSFAVKQRMSKSSPELSPFDNDLSDFHEPNEPELPRIKLKLRLNPSNAKPEDERKKKKHKKKRSHKKHRHRKPEEEEDLVDVDDQSHKRRSRRESEQVNIDEDDEDDEETTPYHVPVGGKRPFALLQAEAQNVHENEEEQTSDSEVHYKKRARYDDVPIKEEPYDAGFDEEDEDADDEENGGNIYRQDHGLEGIPEYPHSYHPTDDSQIEGTADSKAKKRGRPSKGKAMTPSSLRTSEPPRKDMLVVCQKLLETLERRDAYGFFLEPVDTNIVRDYLTVIKRPMDFLTMREKLESGQYQHMEDFRDDFLLIMNNAKTYNAPDTIYWKSADKLLQYGLKAIERSEKAVSYDLTPPTEPRHGKRRQDSWSRKLSNVSASSMKKEALVKVEEEVDILGLDSLPPRKTCRQGSESTMTRETSVDVGISLRDSKKKKKKKVTEAGVIYAPDGSLNAVGGVANLTSLVPQDKPFADPPLITTVNRQALPSAFYLSRPSTYDDMSLNKHLVHAACFANYGPFTTLGTDYPCKFYTAQDAYYVYPLYADDCGEAYMKSIWDFVDGLGLEEKTEEKACYLTHGAWSVMNEVLKNEDRQKIDTEFGSVDVPAILETIQNKEAEPKVL